LIIVTYDIPDDKRRNRIHKELKNFGQWVQYSVFECDLDDRQLQRLRHRLERLMDQREDSIFFYRVCAACAAHVDRLGTLTRLTQSQSLIV
jgi:CRISPR-associated protein Cas2